MEYICLDLEGVLVPEIWSEVATWSGEEKFNLTTQDLKDYSELMDTRINLVSSLGISMEDILKLVQKMEPFIGAKDFLDWSRDRFQVVIVSDSFYELAWPLIRKLGTPPIICHTLDIQDGSLKGYKLRQKNNKKKVVENLKSLKYTVFATGDSYNDIEMLSTADLGVLFQAPQHIRDEFSSFKFVENYEGLKDTFSSHSEYLKR